MLKRFIGLDLGTLTGFCLGDLEGVIHSGTWSFKHESRQERAGFFADKLQGLLLPGLQGIAYERVEAHSGVYAAQLYGALEHVVIDTGKRAGVPVVGYSVGSIKKHATGNGQAMKKVMIARAQQKFMIDPVDDNHADSLWIFDLIRSKNL